MARWARVALEVGAEIGTACRTESIVTGVRRALFYRLLLSLLLQWPDLLVGRRDRPITRMHANAPRSRTRLFNTAREFRAGELMGAGAAISAGLQFFGAGCARRVNQCRAAQMGR